MKRIRIKHDKTNLFKLQLKSLRIDNEMSHIFMPNIYLFIDENPICVVHFYDGYYYLNFIKNHKMLIRRKCIYLKQKGQYEINKI